MTRKMVLLPLALLALTSLGWSWGWGRAKRYGAKIPNGLAVTKLAQIISKPAAFKDKEVLLAGNYGMYCCPTDFTYKEGVDGAEVSPKGFDAPKADRGKPMKLYAVVRLGRHEEGEENGVQRKGKGEKNEEAPSGFYLEAKGVEFK